MECFAKKVNGSEEVVHDVQRSYWMTYAMFNSFPGISKLNESDHENHYFATCDI